MFTLLFKITQAIWRHFSSGREISNPNENIETVICDQKTETSLDGIVTKMCSYQSYGLINDEIYFSFDVVCGEEKVQVGQSVFVKAVRRSAEHGWIAISVMPHHKQWTEDVEVDASCQEILPSEISEGDETCKNNTIELEVTECYGRYGVVGKQYRFNMQDCKVCFSPVIGDILRVTFNASGNRIIEWEPKTLKTVEGLITTHEIDCGIIDNDIIFFFSSCHCNFPLKYNMKVSAVVVESNQQRFKWRAFSLKRLSDTNCGKEVIKPCCHDHAYVSVSKEVDFGRVSVLKEHELEIKVANKSKNKLSLCCCHFQRPVKMSPFSISKSFKPCVIDSNSEISVKIMFSPTSSGVDEALLFLEFDDFMIKRKVHADVFDPMQNILNPIAPYHREPNSHGSLRDQEECALIIPGVKVRNPKANFSGHQYRYQVPKKLRLTVEGEGCVITEIYPVLLEDPCYKNYIEKFSLLLHLEEIKMRQHMDKYDMHEVLMVRKGEFLNLNVPGLADGRPSLLIGDRAKLHVPNGNEYTIYEGYIHEVHRDEVSLRFNEMFQNSYNGETYDVSFEFNRTNFKAMHTCFRNVFKSNPNILFPNHLKLQKPLVLITDSSSENYAKKIDWQNGRLNNRQKSAVHHIVEARCRPLPYIIFGPPGTGKTITLVEAILQIFGMFKDSQILVCTPSNSAADLICQRLIESDMIGMIGKSVIVRMNSYQRNSETIPEYIKPYCVDKDKAEDAVRFPILVTTCSTANALCRLELRPDHFTHIFIDEAGQLTEPEIMIPISLISDHRNGSIVMAGDPKQLGPVLMSDIAKDNGLGLSFLERLMDSSLYRHSKTYSRTSGFNSHLVTMLTDSYRSHPAILMFPSDMFYFSDLKCVEKRDGLVNLPFLRKKDFPIIFHGIRGTEEREENSPSWFNSAEVVESVNYLQKLYGQGLTPADIGIISPYRKQVDKIRLLISALGAEACKIGSVEEFQGQERRAIIITTVRSSKDYMEHDVMYNLGFVSNPKRFNVAVTRAKELLIVIGNPLVLRQDKIFCEFIRFCILHECYTGCDINV